MADIELSREDGEGRAGAAWPASRGPGRRHQGPLFISNLHSKSGTSRRMSNATGSQYSAREGLASRDQAPMR